jgi:hypothetical protein
MRQIRLEKSPLADLPFYLNWATGDAATLYVPLGTESVGAQFVTDWDGNPLAEPAVADSFSGSESLLRISGGTESTTPKKIKVRVVTTPNGYDDEVFIELWVRRPTPSPVA